MSLVCGEHRLSGVFEAQMDQHLTSACGWSDFIVVKL